MTRVLVGGRRGTAWVGVAAALSALLSLVAQIGFERALGTSDFARWAYLNSMCLLWLPIACLGSNHLPMSERFAGRAEGRQAVARLGALYATTSAVACAAFVALCAAGPLAGGPPVALLLVLFLAHIPIILVYPVMQVREWASWVAIWPLLQVGARFATAWTAVVLAWRFEAVVAAWAICCIALCIPAVAWLARAAGRRVASTHATAVPAASVKALATSAVGFGVNDLLEGLDLKLLVPLAAWALSRSETAAAGLVIVMLSAAFFFPHVLVSRLLLPAVHRHGGESPQLVHFVRRLWIGAGLVAVPPALAWWWAGPWLLQRVTAGDYREQALSIALAGPAAVPMVLSMIGSAVHMARDRTFSLLRWRCEALAVFAATAWWWHGFGLPGLVCALIAGRVWLCLRVTGRLVTPNVAGVAS